MTLAARLRQAREARGWSPEELTRRAGLHPYHLRGWEAGTTSQKMQINELIALCRALEVSADWLLGLKEEAHD